MEKWTQKGDVMKFNIQEMALILFSNPFSMLKSFQIGWKKVQKIEKNFPICTIEYFLFFRGKLFVVFHPDSKPLISIKKCWIQHKLRLKQKKLRLSRFMFWNHENKKLWIHLRNNFFIFYLTSKQITQRSSNVKYFPEFILMMLQKKIQKSFMKSNIVSTNWQIIVLSL